MVIRLELSVFAPVPVGHRVSVVYVDLYSMPLFGGEGAWSPMSQVLVCDETTKIIYADRSAGVHLDATYEHLQFTSDKIRVSLTKPPLRGAVVSCLALCDHGETVYFRTVLGIDTPTAPTPSLG